MNNSIWQTKEYWTQKAIEFNPKIKDMLASDPDYCVRGMVHNPNTNMYTDYINFGKDLAKILTSKKENYEN